MHRLGCTGFFLSGILLEFRMFFCIIEEESTQDNTQDNSYTITIPKHEPIKKVYVEMVRQIVESEAENDEDAE